MSGFDEQPQGATPLTHEDLQGLKPSWITTQGELNQAEAENIFRGRAWAFRRRPALWYLSDRGLEALHKQMFGDVWRWAGQLRRRDANIGVDPYRIGVALRDLRDDTLAQIGDDARRPTYPPDELAVRFHHRLVCIHPFPNGNGRHSRLATDLLIRDLGSELFTWGGSELTSTSDLRQDYLSALRRADIDLDFDPLITFARRGR